MGAGHDPDAALGPVLAKHLLSWVLLGTSTARQGVALDLTYTARLRDEAAAAALVRELNQVEGVQDVELRRA